MEQPQGNTNPSEPQKMRYKVRAGTIDSGKKYEYKIATLLSLRCVLNNEKTYLLSNADEVGAFDDVILCQGNKTFMMQLKHKDDPKALVEREFSGTKSDFKGKNNQGSSNKGDSADKQERIDGSENRVDGAGKESDGSGKQGNTCGQKDGSPRKKGDFFLKKYLDDIKKLKDPNQPKSKVPGAINLKSFENIYFILFTNRPTIAYEFLEPNSEIPSFLKTGAQEYKINIDKVPDLPKTEYAGLNIYLLSDQIHIKDIDGKIQEEIQKIAEHYKITRIIINKQMAETFTNYVRDWAEGKLGGHYCLTTFDIVGKLTELFYGQYEVKFDPWNFQSSNARKIWSNIIQDKTLIVIDFEKNILKFLFEYIDHEVSKYCNDCKTWNDTFSDCTQSDFYKNNPCLNTNMSKIIGSHGKITRFDVYKCLWMSKELPLLLEIIDLQQYEDILHILELSNYYYKIIIIQNFKGVLPAPSNVDICFTSLEDLNPGARKEILLQEVKLQGRTQTTLLETVIDEDMYKYIKCKDIINILSGNFNIGNNLNALPDYFISRSISKVFLQLEVLDSVQDAIFLIETTPENSVEMAKKYSNSFQIEIMDINKLNPGIIFTSRTPTREEIEELKSTKKPVHHLLVHSENHLEWKASFGSVQNLRRFETRFENITESNITKKFCSSIVIINAVPGMGKSVLMDYVAQQIPTNKWVLKIDLNDGHRTHYKTKACVNSNTKALEHLEYFKNKLLNQNSKHQLNDAVFQKLSKTKDVIVLLDGFDEISYLYKSEVTNIAKSLHNEGYSVWLTTRPYMTSHLEKELDTFAISLTSFSAENRKEFLMKYFYTEHANSDTNFKTLIETFVEKLLNAAEKNLNDWDAEFTGIPLQTKLLADAFEADCKNYISTKGNYDFNELFDLIYLYETFINKKVDILTHKFGDGAEDNRPKAHQSCFALKLLFTQHENLLEYQYVTEKFNSYYEDEPNKIELLQRDGVVIIDNDFNVNFIHRTYGEYLAAVWLAENLNSSDDKKRDLAHIIIKNRFTQEYKFLFGIFDRILSKDRPLHLAIINNKQTEISKILNSKSQEITKLDVGGRSILHILALYGPQFPQFLEENPPRYVINYKAVKFLNSKKFNTHSVVDIQEILRYNVSNFKNGDLLGYNPLDYALANQSLTIAYIIIQTFPSLTINANMSFKFKKNHLIYSAILNYRPLFNALLPHFISKDLLFGDVDKRELIESYVKNLFRVSNSAFISYLDNKNIKRKIEAFERSCILQYKGKSVLELLHPTGTLKWKWNSKDYSDIRYAICFGSKDNIGKLLTSGIKPNQQDCDYNTLLHYAVLRGNPSIVDMILAKCQHIDVNKQNFQMNTPLHLAFTDMTVENKVRSFLANSQRNRIVKKLMAAKAGTNIKNNDYVTPLHLAVENKKCDWLKLFLSRDGDVNVQDGKGNNCLHLAVVNNFNDILNIIFNNCSNIKIDMKNNEGQTPFFCSVRNNNINIIRQLLNKGANVNMQNMYGESVLHIIATNGYNEAFHEILNSNQSVDINVVDNYGFTPFTSALFNNQIEIVKMLLDCNANIDELNEDGKILLAFAINNKHKNFLSTAVVTSSNIDINRPDKNGRTPLFNAAKNGELEKTLQLLRLEARLDIQDNEGITVLHLFASDGGIEFNDTIIKILNKNFNKIDGNIPDCNGRTPLFYAVQNDKKMTVKLFLSHGADLHIRDKDGTSSLHLIASRGYNDILVNVLADKNNIDINIQDNYGRTPLYYAIQENNKNTVKLLLSNDADLNIQDKNGTSSLHLVANRGYNDIFNILSVLNLHINIQDNEGRTPLLCALQNNNEAMAKLFISKGADFNIQDKNGISPLHLIAGQGYNTILHAIFDISTNINLNVRDNDGRTPLFYASLNNKDETIETLLRNGAVVNTPDSQDRNAYHVATDLMCREILGLYMVQE